MGDRLYKGQSLKKNDRLTSENKKFDLVMQEDGNLVLYYNNEKALWSSGTNGKAVSQCILQGDGNLVIYGFNNPLWASNTCGEPVSFVVLQNDGNLVMYKEQAVWATGTNDKC